MVTVMDGHGRNGTGTESERKRNGTGTVCNGHVTVTSRSRHVTVTFSVKNERFTVKVFIQKSILWFHLDCDSDIRWYQMISSDKWISIFFFIFIFFFQNFQIFRNKKFSPLLDSTCFYAILRGFYLKIFKILT